MEEAIVTETEERAGEADDGGALSPRQELTLQAVISHVTLKEAAAAAGVSDATLWRYMRDGAFSKRLREDRRGAVDHAVGRLQNSTGEAVAVLHGLMMREDAPPAARVSAARTFLDYAARTALIDELREEVDRLKESVRARQEREELADAFLREEEEESS